MFVKADILVGDLVEQHMVDGIDLKSMKGGNSTWEQNLSLVVVLSRKKATAAQQSLLAVMAALHPQPLLDHINVSAR